MMMTKSLVCCCLFAMMISANIADPIGRRQVKANGVDPVVDHYVVNGQPQLLVSQGKIFIMIYHF
jgi:hypothetical protein